MKKILMVSVSDRCYESYRIFATALAEELKAQGGAVEWCYLPGEQGGSEEAWNEVLSEVLGKEYDAVVDFNSFLPKLEASGEVFTSLFGAPFYNILLDHPLYHHRALIAKQNDARVICIDEKHAEYVKKYYPNQRKVHFCPLGGIEGRNAEKPFAERKKEVLFCGTLEDPSLYKKLLADLPAELQKECKELIEEMLCKPEEAMEDILQRLYPEYEGEQFALHMQMDFLADAYVRNQRRLEVLSRLCKEKVPLKLYGRGFELLGLEGTQALTYRDYLDELGNYRYALNIMPGFVKGGHDRIANAMRNRTLCLTDENQYVSEHFATSNCVVSFETGSMDRMMECFETMILDEDMVEEMTHQAYTYSLEINGWNQIARMLLKDIENAKN